jgi:hypothetical protein
MLKVGQAASGRADLATTKQHLARRAQQLRRTSLGSVGVLRVLGGVFRELRAGDNPVELDDITEVFKRLDATWPCRSPRPASGAPGVRADDKMRTAGHAIGAIAPQRMLQVSQAQVRSPEVPSASLSACQGNSPRLSSPRLGAGSG